MNRRHALSLSVRALALGAFGTSVLGAAFAAAPAPEIEVFRNPSCGCCGAWVEHLEAAGFRVKVTMVDDTATVRRKLGLSDRFGSCHTGLIEGYVVEGHVPAADIRKLLLERPKAVGIAVPGMPLGSPGMEMGNRKDPYDVLLVDQAGHSRVFSSYR